MSGYLNSVMITVVVCQIAQMMAPDSDSFKKAVRMICALVMLLTIASPIRYLTTNYDHIFSRIETWLNEENADNSVSDPMEQIAQAVMEHAVQVCSLDPDQMKVTILTDDETGRIAEIQLFVKRCTYAERELARMKLTEIYGIPVSIYNDRE